MLHAVDLKTKSPVFTKVIEVVIRNLDVVQEHQREITDIFSPLFLFTRVTQRANIGLSDVNYILFIYSLACIPKCQNKTTL